jgi:WD40 repeat protein
MLIAGINGDFKIWDLRAQSAEESFKFCEQTVCQLNQASASADGKRLITAHAEGNARVWQVGINPNDKVKKKPLVLPHEQPIIGAYFVSEQEVLTIDNMGNVYVWNTAGSHINIKPIKTASIGHTPTAVAKHPTQAVVYVACKNSGIFKLDLVSLQVSPWLVNNFMINAATHIRFSAMGDLLAVGNRHGQIAIVSSMEQPRIISDWRAHNAGVTNVAFSPDGTQVASAGHDRMLKVYNMNEVITNYFGEPAPIIELSLQHWARAVFFSADGTKIIFGGGSRYLKQYSTSVGNLAKDIKESLRKMLDTEEKKEKVKTELQNQLKGRKDYQEMIELPFK